MAFQFKISKRAFWVIIIGFILYLIFFKNTEAAENTATIDISVEQEELVLGQIRVEDEGSFDLLEIPGDYRLRGEPGEPFLPVRTIFLSVPRGARFVSIKAIHLEETTLPGEYNIYPAQPPVPTV